MTDIPIDPALVVAVAKLRWKLRLSPEEVFTRALRAFLAAHGIQIPEPPTNPSKRTAKARR